MSSDSAQMSLEWLSELVEYLEETHTIWEGYSDEETGRRLGWLIGKYPYHEPDLVSPKAMLEKMRATAAGASDEWRPIETAPMDGMEVELLTHSGKRDIGKWCPSLYGPGGEWNTHLGNCESEADPKAWRPIIRGHAITKREIEAEEDAP